MVVFGSFWPLYSQFDPETVTFDPKTVILTPKQSLWPETVTFDPELTLKGCYEETPMEWPSGKAYTLYPTGRTPLALAGTPLHPSTLDWPPYPYRVLYSNRGQYTRKTLEMTKNWPKSNGKGQFWGFCRKGDVLTCFWETHFWGQNMSKSDMLQRCTGKILSLWHRKCTPKWPFLGHFDPCFDPVFESKFDPFYRLLTLGIEECPLTNAI